MEKRIYNDYAFTENAREKIKINCQIYTEIKDKARVECVAVGYGHNTYKVIENPENLSVLELALICDKGNLCFGYRAEGDLIVIYTD